MKGRAEGQSQAQAAAKAGVSERSARRVEGGDVSVLSGQQRHWRTRQDPFAGVWEREIVPLLEAQPKLTATTLFEALQERYPERYGNGKKRTFQRRVTRWKALYGPDREVMFRQVQEPGRQGLSDFTELKDLVVTIAGSVLGHRLYHFRLAYSGWSYVSVVLGGESFTALAEGLQAALWRLGGAPREHRTDSLSAAYRNLTADDRVDLTTRYDQLCAHYGMVPTRNNRGVSHENGAVESPHGHLKRRLAQALLLRASADFASLADYRTWLDALVVRFNRRCGEAFAIEREHLQALPPQRTTDYSEQVVRVTTSSTIEVQRVLYTVPSRLIGERLRVHLYDDRLEGFLGAAPRSPSRGCTRVPRPAPAASTTVMSSPPWCANRRPSARPNGATSCCRHRPTMPSGSIWIPTWRHGRPANTSSASWPWPRRATASTPWGTTCWNASRPPRSPPCIPSNSASHPPPTPLPGPWPGVSPSTRCTPTTGCCRPRTAPWRSTDMAHPATLLLLRQLKLASMARHWPAVLA